MTTHNPTKQVASRDCRERRLFPLASSPVWGLVWPVLYVAAVYGLGEWLWWMGVGQ